MIKRLAFGLVILFLTDAVHAAIDINADQIGRLTSVGNASMRTFHQYDANGRIVATQYVQDGRSRTISAVYGYPQNPQSTSGPGIVIVSQTLPDGEIVTYAYDASTAQVALRSTFGVVTEDVLRDLRSNARGQVTRIELGNGTITTRSYDESGNQAINLTTTVNAANDKVQEYGYSYDENLNIIGITDGVRSDLSAKYCYDSLNQLTKIIKASATCDDPLASDVIEAYDYDALGNLIQKGAITQTYNAGGRPHALATSGGLTYGYDANGNVISAGGTSIEWNAEDMATRITSGTVVTERSFLGEAAWKKVEKGVTTYYLPSLRIENGILRKYYGGFAERFEQAGARQLRFYHPDQLGSSSVMTDHTGAPIRRVAYLPWGQERGVDGPFVPKLQFNFKEKDEHGFYDYGARLYNPVTGRWLSADDDTSDGPNRYAYVRNNPVTFIDPDGHQKKLPPGVVSSRTEDGRTTYVYKDGTSVSMSNEDVPGTREYRQIQDFNTTVNVIKEAFKVLPGATIAFNRIEGKSWALEDTIDAVSIVLPVLVRGARTPVRVAAPAVTRSVAAGAGAGNRATSSLRMNPNILSGHGAWDMGGWFTVPEGTSITIFTRPGGTISNLLGNAIETGGNLGKFHRTIVHALGGARTYLPGARIPNLTLHPPGDLAILGNPTTVVRPTLLSDLLKPHMGNVKWAACAVGMPGICY